MTKNIKNNLFAIRKIYLDPNVVHLEIMMSKIAYNFVEIQDRFINVSVETKIDYLAIEVMFLFELIYGL